MSPRRGSPASRRRRGAALPRLLLVLLVVGTFLLGRRGLDFGFQWDEPVLIATAQRSVETGLLLPRWYQYPSAYHYALLAAAVPTAREVWREPTAEGDRRRPRLAQRMGGDRYRLHARALFYALTLATAFALFVLARDVTGGEWPALFAVAVLLGSFELTSHARMIAVDGLTMLATTLALLATVRALRAPPGGGGAWLGAAAAAAGLATSTKYPAGVLVAVVAAAAWHLTRRAGHGPARFVREGLGRAALFAAAVLVVTPGLLLDPVQAYWDVTHQLLHYGQQGHHGNTVVPGLDAGAKYALWLAAVAFSPMPALALIVTALALAGAAVLWRDPARRPLLLGVGLLPLLLLLLFSRQTALAVRNLLPALPALAALAAVGATALVAAARRRHAALGAATLAACVALPAADLALLARRMESVRTPLAQADPAPLVRALRAHPDRRYVLSEGVRRLVDTTALLALPNVARDTAGATHALALSIEFDGHTVRGGRLGRYQVLLGPDDISLDWVPSWLGPPRVVALTLDEARIARVGSLTPPATAAPAPTARGAPAASTATDSATPRP